MSDDRTTALRKMLNRLIRELDRLDIALDAPAGSMTLGEYEQAREKLLDGFTQTIAATLGSGTCRCTTTDSAWCFACSECGKSFPRHELHLAHNGGEINYCPNCGRRVEHD